jgi:hypothetical protein
MTSGAKDIANAQIVMTFVNGEKVFEKNNF